MKKIAVVVVKLFLIVAMYLLLIGVTGWCLIKSFDLFLAGVDKRAAEQTMPLKSQITGLKNLVASNPRSLKDIQEYDARNNTQFYDLMKNRSSMYLYQASAYSAESPRLSSKETIIFALNELIYADEQKISAIKDGNKGFWSNLPEVSTLLLAGIGIFFTSLITNFGGFCSGLVTDFRKWLFGKDSNITE